MKPRVVALLGAAALLLLAHPTVTRAQNVASITVDFEFVVHGQTLPAGTYVLRLDPDMRHFTLTQTDMPAPNEGIAVETLSRIAAMQPPRGEPHVVFDKKGDTYFLSEIWLPDEDGWLVYATNEPHTRKVVPAKRDMK